MVRGMESSDTATLAFRPFAPACLVLLLAVCAGLAFFLVWNMRTGPKPERLEFGEMYSGADSLGIRLSPKLRGLIGKPVRMTGFMAPPLKPTLAFFVLTDVPMAICPFCSSDADWPADIVVVKLRAPVTAIPFDRPIWVEGHLEVGTEVDGATGFVSLVRVAADRLGVADAVAGGKP